MSVLSDTTIVHMEVSRFAAAIHRRLRRAGRLHKDPDRFTHELAKIQPIATEIQERLEAFYAREQDELFPRALRIFGSETEEVQELLRLQLSTLAALNQFQDELNKRPPENVPDPPVRLAYLELLFDSFHERFNQRRDAERHFYQTCSTLLYPGGVATD